MLADSMTPKPLQGFYKVSGNWAMASCLVLEEVGGIVSQGDICRQPMDCAHKKTHRVATVGFCVLNLKLSYDSK
jgi:hypothetical protein